MSLINEGTYKAACVAAELGTSGTDKEQVALTFELANDEVFGRRMTWYGFFTEKTFERTIRTLRKVGWQGDDLSDLSSCLYENSGVDVELDVQHENDLSGNLRARVAWVNLPGEGGGLKNAMTPDQAKSFAQRMKGQVIAAGRSKPDMRAKPTQPKKPEPSLSPVPADDLGEDVPY